MSKPTLDNRIKSALRRRLIIERDLNLLIARKNRMLGAIVNEVTQLRLRKRKHDRILDLWSQGYSQDLIAAIVGDIRQASVSKIILRARDLGDERAEARPSTIRKPGFRARQFKEAAE